MANNIVVTSSSHLPRFCAGVSFQGAMAFAADRFSAEQLRALLADRLLTVVVGQVLTPADVDAFVAENGHAGVDASVAENGHAALIVQPSQAHPDSLFTQHVASGTMAPRHAGLGEVKGTADATLQPGTGGLAPAAGVHEADGARDHGIVLEEPGRLPATLGTAEGAAATKAADTALVDAGARPAAHASAHAGKVKAAK